MATKLVKKNRWGDERRFYETEDGVFPSVTTILKSGFPKPQLVPWASRTERDLTIRAAADLYEDLPRDAPPMIRAAYVSTLEQRLGKTRAYQREMEKAADIGSQAHARCEWVNHKALGRATGPEPHCRPESLMASVAYEDWLRQNDAKLLHVEQTVWHGEHGYAGTLDFAAMIGGKLTVCDLKTSNAVYPDSLLQVAAYAAAYRWMGHGDPVQGCIIRLPKSAAAPAFEAVEFDNLDELYELFLGVFRLWKWLASLEKEN